MEGQCFNFAIFDHRTVYNNQMATTRNHIILAALKMINLATLHSRRDRRDDNPPFLQVGIDFSEIAPDTLSTSAQTITRGYIHQTKMNPSKIFFVRIHL